MECRCGVWGVGCGVWGGASGASANLMAAWFKPLINGRMHLLQPYLPRCACVHARSIRPPTEIQAIILTRNHSQSLPAAAL